MPVTLPIVSMGMIGRRRSGACSSIRGVPDRQAWRYRIFVVLYIVILLTISTSLFTIKTAALLWFLSEP